MKKREKVLITFKKKKNNSLMLLWLSKSFSKNVEKKLPLKWCNDNY